MGKVRYTTDSDDTDGTWSSVENLKKKKFSILKCTTGNAKKKKCKIHAMAPSNDSEYRSRSCSNPGVRYKPSGILKYNRDRDSSDEDEDSEPLKLKSRDRCLVGRVPTPAGAKPGRGGGVALVVKKNITSRIQSSIQPRDSTSGTKRKRYSKKQLMKKHSYY